MNTRNQLTKLSTSHDALIRTEFDTLQIIDNMKMPPDGRWYTSGDATQAVTGRNIIIDDIADLR